MCWPFSDNWVHHAFHHCHDLYNVHCHDCASEEFHQHLATFHVFWFGACNCDSSMVSANQMAIGGCKWRFRAFGLFYGNQLGGDGFYLGCFFIRCLFQSFVMMREVSQDWSSLSIWTRPVIIISLWQRLVPWYKRWLTMFRHYCLSHCFFHIHVARFPACIIKVQRYTCRGYVYDHRFQNSYRSQRNCKGSSRHLLHHYKSHHPLRQTWKEDWSSLAPGYSDRIVQNLEWKQSDNAGLW